MAALTTALLLGGLAISAAGAATQYVGQQKAAKAQADAANAQLAQQQAIEAQRRKQMELEAARLKRNTVRQALAARSQALALANNRGAGSSSALAGAEASISGRLGSNELAINQNAEIGGAIFDINAQYASQIAGDYRSAASGNSLASLGQGFQSIGGALMKNDVLLSKVGNYAATSFNATA